MPFLFLVFVLFSYIRFQRCPRLSSSRLCLLSVFSPHDVTVHESSRHTSLDPDSRMHIEVVHPKERVTNSSNENFYPLFHVQLCILKSYKLYLLSRKYATFQYAERRGICFICSVTEHLTNHIEWYRWH